jgi:hypothetical protein
LSVIFYEDRGAALDRIERGERDSGLLLFAATIM